MAPTKKAFDLLQTKGKEKGLWGDSGTWLAVWVLIGGVRWLVKRSTPGPTVITETLEPGERLIITHFAKGVVPTVESAASK